MRSRLSIVVVVALFSSVASADLLWDNGITPNGFNGRAISPPAFPNIRVADDFIVPDGDTWWIEHAHFNIIEDAGWDDGGFMTVTFYEDVENLPGAIIAERTVAAGFGFEKMSTGDTYFARDDFDYWVEFVGDPVHLEGGKYWIGTRNPSGRGAGTNYWMTSDGGIDGMNSRTGAYSLDEGNNWMDEGAENHHAFTITGVPEPVTLLLLGLGGLAVLRRRHQAATPKPRGDP